MEEIDIITSEARGVRKLSERNLQAKRALILTEEDTRKLDWSEIPVGTIKVNQYTGMMSIKLQDVLVLKENGRQLENHFILQAGDNPAPTDKVYEIKDRTLNYYKGEGCKVTSWTRADIEYSSQTDWLPIGIKNDGTISIAKDVMYVEEVFTVVDPRKDIQGLFEYTNAQGEHRHMPFTDEGYPVFELEQGTYSRFRNHLEVTLDDALNRSARSKGIIEISEKRFAITDELHVGEELTVRYLQTLRVGNPYPRIFVSNKAPTIAEENDFWLDTNDGPYESDVVQLP
mgnify:FL=1